MQRKFCFMCGRQATIEGQCEECWRKKHPLAELPEKIEFVQCPKCDLVKSRNAWVLPDFEKLIKDSAKTRGKITGWEINPQKGGYEVTIYGETDGIKKKETHAVTLHAIRNVCPTCGKLLSGYYEAILQMRGDFSGFALEAVERGAAQLRKADNMAFFRREEVKGGIDYFFGSKKAAKKIAETLRKRFNAELTSSFQVAGRKGGKELRRTIIAVRFVKTD